MRLPLPKLNENVKYPYLLPMCIGYYNIVLENSCYFAQKASVSECVQEGVLKKFASVLYSQRPVRIYLNGDRFSW